MDSSGLEQGPILVYLVPDTLGTLAAQEDGWCAQLQALFRDHRLDLSCHQGGVAPSSWTLETHLRALWPSHNRGAKRALLSPSCADPSALRRIATQHGAAYFMGLDNAVFDFVFPQEDCADGRSAWVQGTRQVESMPLSVTLAEQAAMAEEDFPMVVAMQAMLDEAAQGGPVVGLFNEFLSGGHLPRCFFDPTTTGCEQTWDFAVAQGIVAQDDPRYDAFLTEEVWATIVELAQKDDEVDAEALRETFWATTMDSVQHWREQRLQPRLESMLEELESMGRLDDLVFVMVSDHGEAPCTDKTFKPERQCGHGGMPTDWSAQVPLFVSPASLGEAWVQAGYVGDAEHPWSTTNLAWALTGSLGLEPGQSWPEPQPVGSADSITCYTNTNPGYRWGLHVDGQQSVRCGNSGCASYDWHAMAHAHDSGTQTDELPEQLLPYTEHEGYLHWFDAACDGAVVD